jgi:hypothetical protein
VDIVEPQTVGQQAVARRNLYLLELEPWGRSVAPHTQQLPLNRLRHLVDAREASCAFRVPVPQPDGIDGVPLQAAAPFRRSFGARAVDPRGALELAPMLHRGQTSGEVLAVPVHDLNRHALIVGNTGSGKTAACMSLLDQFWNRFKIPFLVIEPVKSEYRALHLVKGLDELLIFTAGDDDTSPLRLNPFAFDPGIRMDRHLSGLKAVFTSVLPMFGPLPMILKSCLYQVYTDRGWQSSDDGSRGEQLGFPTLTDLYQAVSQKIEQLNYMAEVRSNIEAASKVRIDSLRTGAKGRMLDVRRSIPLDELMGKPAVIELKCVGDTDEKALIAGVLVLRIAEFCETARRGQPEGLRHVTVLEEAHQLLRHVPASRPGSEEADPRGRAVESLCNLLAEIRAYGEGILIVDQTPGDLAPAAIKNTNLKVMLQLPAESDRRAVGSTMRLSEDQMRFTSGLRRGQAATFISEMEEAVLIEFQDYKYEAGIKEKTVEDVGVRQFMNSWWAERLHILRPFACCARCPGRTTCPSWERTRRLAQDAAVRAALDPHVLGVLAGGPLGPALQMGGRTLQQKTNVRWQRDELSAAVYCLVCQVAEEISRKKIAAAGFGEPEVAQLLDLFAAAARAALTGPEDAQAATKVHQCAAGVFRPQLPPIEACEPCRRQCFFRPEAKLAIQDTHFQEAVGQAHQHKDLKGMIAACEGIAERVVTPEDPESQHWAAFCCFLAELERRGTRDLKGMAELFLRET